MPDIRRPLPGRNTQSFNNDQFNESAGESSYGQAASQSQSNPKWLVIMGGAVIILILAAIIIKLITGSVFGWWSAETNSWQAVFLSNNTVYFGRVSETGSWLLLHDIYYLQRAQTPQPSGDQQATDQNKLVLIKLGNELHGPEDYMKINKDHVIFIENLRTDSQVVKAIEKYLQDQSQNK